MIDPTVGYMIYRISLSQLGAGDADDKAFLDKAEAGEPIYCFLPGDAKAELRARKLADDRVLQLNAERRENNFRVEPLTSIGMIPVFGLYRQSE
jgi:hypothetical protein